MSESHGDARVTYTIKELLQDIRLSIAALDTKLDSKADKADVAILVQQQHSQDKVLESHSQRLDILERSRQERVESKRFKTPLIISLCTTIASPLIWVGLNHVIR